MGLHHLMSSIFIFGKKFHENLKERRSVSSFHSGQDRSNSYNNTAKNEKIYSLGHLLVFVSAAMIYLILVKISLNTSNFLETYSSVNLVMFGIFGTGMPITFYIQKPKIWTHFKREFLH